jgi:putative pyrroloquinoline-quinone binding quinoprotein
MGDGIYTIYREETRQLFAFSAATGQQLWVSDPRPNALGAFCTGEVIAYGLIYVDGYDGYIYAYNETTGAVAWSFYVGSANPSGLETPYGQYTVYGGNIVADGMLIAINQEHTEQSPLFVGEGMYVINATTGKLIWQTRGQIKQPSLAGGILVGPNMCDGQIYAFGKGPSKITVTAPDVGVTTATQITITGSITDVSAGASQEAVAANFPNGLPCVSDASMTQFMEAVYEQQPMPANITGVPVTVTVLDSNGNYRTIGTTTTNALGNFALTWKPDITGNYTLYAIFAGTGGYYGSSASTAFSAGSTATAVPSASPLSLASTQNYIMYGVIAIIIVIIIIGVVLAILVTRKRP